MKDSLSSDHLVESFDGRSYTYGSVLKSNFYHKTTQEDGHYRKNPSNQRLPFVEKNVWGPHPALIWIWKDKCEVEVWMHSCIKVDNFYIIFIFLQYIVQINKLHLAHAQ